MFCFIIMIILISYKRIKRCIRKIAIHLSEFYFDIDPIKDCASLDEIVRLKQKRPFYRPFSHRFPWLKVNLHFLIPALVVLAFHLDNLYVVYIRYGGEYNATGMPELITHRITPDIFWDISDILIDTGVLQECCIYFYLTQVPNISTDYFMFAVWNEATQKRTIYYRGKFWKQDKSDKLLEKRSRLRRIYSVALAAVLVQLYLYFVGYHHLNGDNYTTRNKWLYLYLSVWVVYSTYGVIALSFYFHLVTTYIRFKQSYKLRKMASLLDELSLVSTGKHPTKNVFKLRYEIWKKFCVYNGKVLSLFREIGAFSRFWSLILTVIVFGFVIMICYLSYAVFLGEADTILKKSLYIFFSAQMFISIMLITSKCSSMVRKNVEIYKCNRRFAFTFSSTLQPTNSQLLKLSKIVSNYKGTRTGFRYINNGIIDSRMFEILFLSISVLFMKIFKKKIMGVDYVGIYLNFEAHLPQTQILPLFDLVITHGGNNTVTETFTFGKPMIVLSLFADQYDNAQRIQEKGYGIRLEPYTFKEEELLKAIDQLLNDHKLKDRLEAAKHRIAESNSKERACERIEKLAKPL